MEYSEKGIRMEQAYFGPFWRFLKSPKITDIDYNGSELWITEVENERYPVIEHGITDKFIEQFPEADVSIVHESVAVSGRSVCIRKSLPKMRLSVESALREEYCQKEVLALLINCVLSKMNMVFCGEPGCGKTECAKFFSQFIPAHERVITIEDNPEWHYSRINPGKDCVELRICGDFDYTKAIKTCLRQNPAWIMLSEARSVEVKSLLECWSTGIRGFTTLHTDDVRKIPDRILNMMESRYDANRLENDVYSYVDVGVLLRRRKKTDGRVYRYMDQLCFFTREQGINMVSMLVWDGKLEKFKIPEGVRKIMSRYGIEEPFNNREVRG